MKPNTSANAGVLSGAEPNGRWTINNATLKLLIEMAYTVQDFQIVGGSNWLGTDKWDIQAKAHEGSIPTDAGAPRPTAPNHPLTLMLQSLLEERFQLKVHREIREQPVYELTIAKSGSKMRRSTHQDELTVPEPPQGQRPRQGSIRLNVIRGDLEANGVPIAQLGLVLSDSRILGRAVIDRTGLNGLYDFSLKWMPDVPSGLLPPGVQLPPPDLSAPSLVTALEEQLGLKLESSKGPVEVLVIDSVQRPSEN